MLSFILVSLIKVCKINPLLYLTFSFQSPFKYVIFVLITSLILKIPRFFHFKLIRVYEVPEYWTTVIMEDPIYIRFSSYWDDLFVTGVLPLGMAIFFNLKAHECFENIWGLFEYGFGSANATLSLIVCFMFLFAICRCDRKGRKPVLRLKF